MRSKTLSTGIWQPLIVGCLLLLLSTGAWAQGSLTIRGSVVDASRDYWTEDNQGAYWPRLYNYNGDMYNFQPSDKWVQNAAYLRLKNITLGYTIPIHKRYIRRGPV